MMDALCSNEGGELQVDKIWQAKPFGAKDLLQVSQQGALCARRALRPVRRSITSST